MTDPLLEPRQQQEDNLFKLLNADKDLTDVLSGEGIYNPDLDYSFPDMLGKRLTQKVTD